ncbi:hypothetical protein AB3K78_07425 [Leucobacter sp. HNU]|uniref:hypothetical protein n=1 Tax=Leucobacter sp. HNU TaxID=3236805 RepID=UPI003A80BA8B
MSDEVLQASDVMMHALVGFAAPQAGFMRCGAFDPFGGHTERGDSRAGALGTSVQPAGLPANPIDEVRCGETPGVRPGPFVADTDVVDELDAHFGADERLGEEVRDEAFGGRAGREGQVIGAAERRFEVEGQDDLAGVAGSGACSSAVDRAPASRCASTPDGPKRCLMDSSGNAARSPRVRMPSPKSTSARSGGAARETGSALRN